MLRYSVQKNIPAPVYSAAVARASWFGWLHIDDGSWQPRAHFCILVFSPTQLRRRQTSISQERMHREKGHSLFVLLGSFFANQIISC